MNVSSSTSAAGAGVWDRVRQLKAAENHAGDPSVAAKVAAADSVSTSNGGAWFVTLTKSDIYDLQGFNGESFSVDDAAEMTHRHRELSFTLFDEASTKRSLEAARRYTRVEDENGRPVLRLMGKELEDYKAKLRGEGLKEVDWKRLRHEFESGKEVTADDLSAHIDYCASRYAAVLDKIERNYSGDELAGQKAELDAVWREGRQKLAEGYVAHLRDGIGLSDADAKEIGESIEALLDERIKTYQGALARVDSEVKGIGEDAAWVRDHDGYIAARLREAAGTQGASKAKPAFSLEELTELGRVSEQYSSAARRGLNEDDLALEMAFLDMQVDTRVAYGDLDSRMGSILRGGRSFVHQHALDVTGENLERWEAERSKKKPAGTYGKVDRAVFSAIYNAAMNAFRANGGDAVKALISVEDTARSATRAAHRRQPAALRFQYMDSVWDNFANSSQISGYADRWKGFLSSIGARAGVDTRA